MKPELLHVKDFASDAARWILACAVQSIATRGLFRLALAGGETPAAVYSEMARSSDAPDWSRVQITFGDERCVPPDDAQSNYLMARRSLLDHAPIPSGNIFRIAGEADPDHAALQCEAQLRAVATRMGEPCYRHDLVLLGLGPDGHTASLFPGSPALAESQRWLIPTIGPKPPPQRITMTYPLLNAARHVAFLVNDPKKQPVIDDILAHRGNHPAGAVQPTEGSLTWIIGPGK